MMERYCFLVTAVKTNNFTYITVVVIFVLNFLVNLSLKYLKPERRPSRLHELFQIERNQEVPTAYIGLIG